VSPRLLTVLGLVAASLAGCARREPPDVALARSAGAHLERQIAGLEETIARAERGELTTTDRIAIGVSEELASRLLNAALPFETVVADRVRIRVESAEPYFRGTRTAILFRASVASTDVEGVAATIDLGGGLADFQLEDGRLRSRVSLDHVSVLESAAGELAADALDGLLRANLQAIEGAIPPVELPVQLEEAIAIGGLTEGAVVARPGSLPLEMALHLVLVSRGRLWVLIDARTGEWQPADPEPRSPDERSPDEGVLLEDGPIAGSDEG
jgi:hypothetical protein